MKHFPHKMFSNAQIKFWEMLLLATLDMKDSQKVYNNGICLT